MDGCRMDRSHAKLRPEGKPKREVIYIAQTNKQTNKQTGMNGMGERGGGRLLYPSHIRMWMPMHMLIQIQMQM